MPNKAYVMPKSKPKYNVNLESFLNIPANVYWKDQTGIHLGCNEYAAHDHGLQSSKDYIGLTIFDISKSKSASVIDKTDKTIMKSGQQNCLIESSGALLTKQGVYFSIKSPFYDQEGLAGLFGISFKLSEYNLSNITSALQVAQKADGFKIIGNVFSKYYASVSILESAGLTQRESAILVYLCQGKSAKIISEIFDISKRTVETHIEHIRMKTQCKTKYELIEKFLVLYSHSWR